MSLEALKAQNDINVVLYFFDRIFMREDPQYIVGGDENYVGFRTPDHKLLEKELTDAGFRRDSRQNGLLAWSARASKWNEFKAVHRHHVEAKLQESFREILEQYKLHYQSWLLTNPDGAAEPKALSAVHRAQTTGATEVDVAPDDLELAEQLLRMGMVCVPSATDDSFFGRHVWHLMYDQKPQVAQYAEVCRETRASYHSLLAARNTQELRRLMLAAFPEGCVCDELDTDGIQTALRTFVQKWKSQWGCRPFLYGLQDVLQHHLKSTYCAEWELTNDIFTQSGGSTFMLEAVGLLATMDFRPRDPVAEWRFDGAEHRNLFTVSPLYTDRQLRRLIGLFEPRMQEDKSHGRVLTSSVVARCPPPEASVFGGALRRLSHLTGFVRSRENDAPPVAEKRRATAPVPAERSQPAMANASHLYPDLPRIVDVPAPRVFNFRPTTPTEDPAPAFCVGAKPPTHGHPAHPPRGGHTPTAAPAPPQPSAWGPPAAAPPPSAWQSVSSGSGSVAPRYGGGADPAAHNQSALPMSFASLGHSEPSRASSAHGGGPPQHPYGAPHPPPAQAAPSAWSPYPVAVAPQPVPLGRTASGGYQLPHGDSRPPPCNPNFVEPSSFPSPAPAHPSGPPPSSFPSTAPPHPSGPPPPPFPSVPPQPPTVPNRYQSARHSSGQSAR